MSASLRANILTALADRLAKIRTSNGYPQDVRKIYVDEIPMGIQLSPQQLPAIFVLDDQDLARHEHQSLDFSWKIELQLVLGKVKDSVVHELVRSVGKCLYADSPTAENNFGFRFHPAVTWIELLAISGDLNMIEANRLCSVELVVHYRARPYDL